MIAIEEAARRIGSWRLLNTVLYVTMEPCPMCAGAIVQARIPHLVYGAPDEKAGAAGTLFNVCQDERLNHCLEIDQRRAGGRIGGAAAPSSSRRDAEPRCTVSELSPTLRRSMRPSTP